MSKPATNAVAPDAAAQLDIYRRMLRIERNDDATRKQIRLGRITAPYYSARGQEVIPSTISHLLRKDDTICTIYRGIHDMVAKDMPLRPLWAEIAGRVDGTCKGKGGPMHLTHPESGVMVTTGIVGSSLPIANGLALAAQLDGTDQVSVAYFGDGASNIGAFHEALNMAALWKLPVLFVCQNNGYGEHTRLENHLAVDLISKRAIGYGMPGYTVDGNDPFDMYAHAHAAVARARAGEGPTLLECKTFRFMGHVFGDDDKYMREGEVQDAIDFAFESPFPDLAELRRDVFAEEIPA
jgi:acetoin:2,6-dichlorophenolindophenol oxidoreductase subunit alpha